MALESIYVKIEGAFEDFLKKFRSMLQEAEKSAKIKVDISSTAAKKVEEINEALNDSGREAERVRRELGGVEEDFGRIAGIPGDISYGLSKIAKDVIRAFPADKMDIVKILNIPGINEKMPQLLNSLRTKAKIMAEIAKLAKEEGYSPGVGAAERLAKSAGGESLVSKGKKEFKGDEETGEVERAFSKLRYSIGRGGEDFLSALSGGGEKIVKSLYEIGSDTEKDGAKLTENLGKVGAGLARMGFAMANLANDLTELRKASSRMAIDMTAGSGTFAKEIQKTVEAGGDLTAVMMGNTEASRQAQQAFAETAISVGKTPQEFASLGQDLRKSGALIGGAVVDPLSKGGQEMMASLSMIGKTIGLSDEKIASLGGAMSQLRGKTGDTTQSLAFLRTSADFAKVDIGMLADSVEESADLVSMFGGNIDQAMASQSALIRNEREWGLTQKAAIARTREMAESGKNATLGQRFLMASMMEGTTEMNELKNAMAKAFPNMKSMGTLDVAGMLRIALKNASTKGQATALLDALIGKLVKQFGQLSPAMADSIVQMTGQSADAVDTAIARVMGAVEKKPLGDDSPTDLNSAMNKIAGDSDKLSESLNAITAPMGEFATQAKEASKRLMDAVKREEAESTRNAIAALGTTSMEATTKMNEAMIQLKRSVADFAGKVDSLMPGFTGMSGIIAGIVGSLIQAGAGIVSLAATLGSAGAVEAIKTFVTGALRAGGALLGPAGLVAATAFTAYQLKRLSDSIDEWQAAEDEAKEKEAHNENRDVFAYKKVGEEDKKLREIVAGLDEQGQKEYAELKKKTTKGLRDKEAEKKKYEEETGEVSQISLEQEAGKSIRAMREGLESIQKRHKERTGADTDMSKLKETVGNPDWKKFADPAKERAEKQTKELEAAQKSLGAPTATSMSQVSTTVMDEKTAEKMTSTMKDFKAAAESIKFSSESMKSATESMKSTVETIKNSTTTSNVEKKEYKERSASSSSSIPAQMGSNERAARDRIAERKGMEALRKSMDDQRKAIESMPENTEDERRAKIDSQSVHLAKRQELFFGKTGATAQAEKQIIERKSIDALRKSMDDQKKAIESMPEKTEEDRRAKIDATSVHLAKRQELFFGKTGATEQMEKQIAERKNVEATYKEMREQLQKIQSMPEKTEEQRRAKADELIVHQARWQDKAAELQKTSSMSTKELSSEKMEKLSERTNGSKSSTSSIELNMPTTINVDGNASLDDYMNQMIPVLRKSMAEVINRMHNEENVAKNRTSS